MKNLELVEAVLESLQASLTYAKNLHEENKRLTKELAKLRELSEVPKKLHGLTEEARDQELTRRGALDNIS